MDIDKLRGVYERLEVLDDRLTHKIRPRQAANMGRMDGRLMEARVKDLSVYTVELKDIVRDLVESLAVAARKAS